MSRFVLGQWNCICDRCGFQFKSAELKKEWTGRMVCGGCWEPRHPQDLIRVRAETAVPDWTRPKPEDVFITIIGDNILTESEDFLRAESVELLFTET